MVLLTCDKNHINNLIFFEDSGWRRLLTTASNFATIMWLDSFEDRLEEGVC